MEWIKLSQYNLPPQGLKIICFKAGDLWIARRLEYKGKSVYIEIPFDPVLKANLTPEPIYWTALELPEGCTGYIKVGIDEESLMTVDELQRKHPKHHTDFVKMFMSGIERRTKGKNLSEWISLMDKLPPLSTWVLGLTEQKGIHEVRRPGNSVEKGYKRTDWVLPYYLHDNIVITHWMPMPKMPDKP